MFTITRDAAREIGEALLDAVDKADTTGLDQAVVLMDNGIAVSVPYIADGLDQAFRLIALVLV